MLKVFNKPALFVGYPAVSYGKWLVGHVFIIRSNMHSSANQPLQESRKWEIRPESFWLNWHFAEIWYYRHLMLRLVRRDFLIHHQQTVLGPLWIVFQPMIMLIMYMIVFEKAVGLSTDGVSPALFYLAGIILYNLFAESFSGTSFTFIQNAGLFGKVYFPRLIIPFAIVVMNLIRFGIQFGIFLALLLFIQPENVFTLSFRWIPALIFSVSVTALLGLGAGLIFSILTAKYRDLINIIHLIARIMMFASPIVYPISMVNESLRKWIFLNPLSSLIEYFRFGFLGAGTFEVIHLFYSLFFAVFLVGIGSMLFNKFSNKLQDVI
jgi:lipopolysaccharide transport system permease protein